MKRGVWQAGGFPAELPAMAVSETFMKPSSMLYRNFLAMQVEEMLRSHPCDGAVLMGGCDKTTPGVLMGALSMDIPIIFVPGEHRRLRTIFLSGLRRSHPWRCVAAAGPMLRGNSRGNVLGSGSDQWAAIDEYRAGTIDEGGLRDVEEGIARSAGALPALPQTSRPCPAARLRSLGSGLCAARRALHDGGDCLDNDRLHRDHGPRTPRRLVHPGKSRQLRQLRPRTVSKR